MKTSDDHKLQSRAKTPVASDKKRHRMKMCELTFARCEMKKEKALELLQEVFGERLRRYQIARETHKGEHGSEGSHHLHIFLEFDSVVELPLIKLSRLFGQHPHCARVRSPSSFLAYIAKEDFPLGNFDLLEEAWNYTGSKRLLVKRLFEGGATFYEIFHRYSDQLWAEDFLKYFKMELRFKEARIRAERRAMRGIEPITRSLIKQRLTPAELKRFDKFKGYSRLVKHINQINEYRFRQPHTFRQNCLIVGKTGIGKSTLLRSIMKYVPTYEFPIDNWHPDYEDGVYTLILWDEPKITSGMVHTYLKILDGLTCNLPVKGSRAVRQDHQKIICLSNETLAEHSKKLRSSSPEQKKAFERRLDEINFGIRKLNFLQKLIVPLGEDISSFCEESSE